MGLIQLDPLISQHIAQVVESPRVVLIQVQQLPEYCLGLGKLFEALEDGGLRKQDRNLLIRSKLLRFLDRRQGFLKVLSLFPQLSQ